MILSAVLFLGAIGMTGAIILYAVAQKYRVDEDTRIAEIQEILPGANCGGCGYPGCGAFAEACAKSVTLDELRCPFGEAETMNRIADILGFKAGAVRKTAVVRCNGSCAARPRLNRYDGTKHCAVTAAFYGGETGCSYGCFGYGDCVRSCRYDAIRIHPETHIAEVDKEKCTSCGACVKACPKGLIELRKEGPKSRLIYVSCMNKDKGAMAKEVCANSCTGCTRCRQECKFEAITISDNLAYIDDTKCRLCHKCVEVCSRKAIRAVNFPVKKEIQTITNDSSIC